MSSTSSTWSSRCVAELPQLVHLYEKHREAGFEIIGISLDTDRQTLTNFVTEKKIDWPLFFDGNGRRNELAQKYGIAGIPATYLLDREGQITGVDLPRDSLDEAVAAALAKK